MHVGIHGAERSIARSHQLTLHVIINVLISVRHIRGRNFSHSLEALQGQSETGGTAGKLGKRARGAQHGRSRERRKSGVVGCR
jgi:hypothetical protein